jgi:hypothetical protein
MTVATYPTVAMSGYGLNTDSEEAFQASYNTKFTRLLNQPQGRAFVVEHAGWFPYGSSEVYYPDSTWYPQWLQGLAIPSGTRLYLTRLRTVLTPAQMTQDVLLTAAPTDEPVKILVSKARPLGGEATLAFVLACLIMTLACRRQGWGVKEFVVGTLLLGALVLGMIL